MNTASETLPQRSVFHSYIPSGQPPGPFPTRKEFERDIHTYRRSGANIVVLSLFSWPCKGWASSAEQACPFLVRAQHLRHPKMHAPFSKSHLLEELHCRDIGALRVDNHHPCAQCFRALFHLPVKPGSHLQFSILFFNA